MAFGSSRVPPQDDRKTPNATTPNAQGRRNAQRPNVCFSWKFWEFWELRSWELLGIWELRSWALSWSWELRRCGVDTEALTSPPPLSTVPAASAPAAA